MSTPELREPSFWVLTALAAGRNHGYALIQETRSLSHGRVDLKVPTLYAALERLHHEGLVSPDGDEVLDGRLRRYFRLTDEGAARLSVEIDRMEANASQARARLQLRSRPSTRRAHAWTRTRRSCHPEVRCPPRRASRRSARTIGTSCGGTRNPGGWRTRMRCWAHSLTRQRTRVATTRPARSGRPSHAPASRMVHGRDRASAAANRPAPRAAPCSRSATHSSSGRRQRATRGPSDPSRTRRS